jgi:hypothetical protein
MTVPNDLFARFALRTKQQIEAVEASSLNRPGLNRSEQRATCIFTRFSFPGSAKIDHDSIRKGPAHVP